MWEKYDHITIAKEQKFSNLQIYLDYGDKDEWQFYLVCKELYELLKSKNVSVENHVFRGYHDRKYVMSNLKNYLKFYSDKQRESLEYSPMVCFI